MSFQALIKQSFVAGSGKSSPLTKWASFGDVDVIRRQTSTPFRIILSNIGNSPINVTSFQKQQAINGFYSIDPDTGELGWTIMGGLGEQDRDWGFRYTYFIKDITASNPLIIKPNENIDFAEIVYDGAGLSEKELHIDYGVVFTFNTNDPTQSDIVTARISNNQVVLEAHPVGLRWEPKAKIIHSKNIHGYPATPKIRNHDTWKKYAETRISETLLNYGISSLGRVKISEFLNKDSFLNNKKFDDTFPEMKRVLNRFKDPLPPYDFIWPYGDGYAYNGARRTYDYRPNSRIENFYRNLQTIFLNKERLNRLNGHQFMEGREIPGVDPSILKELNLNTGEYVVRQRREWGFREKSLKGFPYYIPKYIESNILGEGTVFGNCGTGPIIAGFVTAGSGIFSGIQPAIPLEYDYLESQRTIRAATDSPYGKPKIPNGLIFIQDETGAIGFSIGTDMRYMDSPLHYDAEFSKPSVGDVPHLGSHGLPKPDYRQFLREGDLIFIQLGVGFKYWHPVLGSEPQYWESLRGINELGKAQESEKINYPEETLDLGDVDPTTLDCLCLKDTQLQKNWIEIGEFESTISHQYMGPSPNYEPYPLPSGKLLFNPTPDPNRFPRWDGERCGDTTISEIYIPYLDKKRKDNFDFIKNAMDKVRGFGQWTNNPSDFFLKIVGSSHSYEFKLTGRGFVDQRVDLGFSVIDILYQSYTTTKVGTEDCGPLYKIFMAEVPRPVGSSSGRSKKCFSVMDYMDAENKRGATPPYPCKNMKPNEQKIVRFTTTTKTSASKIVSFVFSVDAYGNCSCRKLLSGLDEVVSDYIWPQPPTKNFPYAKPYVDNWGGFTNPKINKAKETAIDIPDLGLGYLVPGASFAAQDQPEIFDAGFPQDESVREWVRIAIQDTVSYGNLAIDLIENLIFAEKPPTTTEIAVGIVLSVSVIELMKSIYLRNRHILPSRTIRDTQYPYTDFHPIQDEHPWSTGTPIPINSGMEFIMAEVFSVDTRERFAPAPLEITAAQFRGIPEDTYQYDPDDEWKIPKDYQERIETETINIGSNYTRGNDISVIIDGLDLREFGERYEPNRTTDDPTCKIMQGYFEELNSNPNSRNEYPCKNFSTNIKEQYVSVEYTILGQSETKLRNFRFFVGTNNQCQCAMVKTIPPDYTNRGSIITKSNQFDEFPYGKNEPDTPYTKDPGSIYKGQLVTLKNVTFVEPPKKKIIVPKPASKERVDLFKKQHDDIFEQLRAFLNEGMTQTPRKQIKDFELDISNTPFSNLNLPDISNSVLTVLDILESIITLAQTVLSLFGDTIIPAAAGETEKSDPNAGTGGQAGQNLNNPLEPSPSINYRSYVTSFLNVMADVNKKVLDVLNRIKDMETRKVIRGFKDEVELQRFLALMNGIDFTGFRMRVNYERELLSFLFGSIDRIDLNKILTDFSFDVLTDLLGDKIGPQLDKLNGAWNLMYVQEIHEVDESYTGPVEPTLEFEEITFVSDFPWSVDKKDGGYWWACPDIPLTNARSHQNDQNWGDPANTTDNDDGIFFRNQDTGFGFISNLDPNARRHVFSQLISSDKANLSVPIFDLYDQRDLGDVINSLAGEDASFEIKYGRNKHEYDMGYIRPRFVRDLGHYYSSSYMPFAEEWKPYRWEKNSDGQPIKNEFVPIKPGTRFWGNRVYYVVDENNVVVPIRINVNTEIARYYPYVPTGKVNITGIAWQYSSGNPGLEWEREKYIMQIWPRYFSDVGLKWTPPKPPKLPELDGPREPDTPVVPPPSTPETPRKLPDLTLDIGDTGNPARLDCESVRQILDSQNSFKEEFKKMISWPVIGAFGENNVHQDPVSGRQITLPSNQDRLNQMLNSMPDYPCKGMKIGEQQTVTITSQQFPGVERKFFFTVGPNGECLCTMYQVGSENGETNERRQDVFSDREFPSNDGGIIRRGNTNRILG